MSFVTSQKNLPRSIAETLSSLIQLGYKCIFLFAKPSLFNQMITCREMFKTSAKDLYEFVVWLVHYNTKCSENRGSTVLHSSLYREQQKTPSSPMTQLQAKTLGVITKYFIFINFLFFNNSCKTILCFFLKKRKKDKDLHIIICYFTGIYLNK